MVQMILKNKKVTWSKQMNMETKPDQVSAYHGWMKYNQYGIVRNDTAHKFQLSQTSEYAIGGGWWLLYLVLTMHCSTS